MEFIHFYIEDDKGLVFIVMMMPLHEVSPVTPHVLFDTEYWMAVAIVPLD